jgi:hypothetical protein
MNIVASQNKIFIMQLHLTTTFQNRDWEHLNNQKLVAIVQMDLGELNQTVAFMVLFLSCQKFALLSRTHQEQRSIF